MKLITLNCHSLAEAGYEEKLRRFIRGILLERPDILALQEANQTMNGPLVPREALAESGYHSPREESPPAVPIREDNHAFRCAQMLSQAGLQIFWTWLPVKTGYSRYDEGLALLSLSPLLNAAGFYLTACRDYGNWRTRKALLARLQTPLGIHYACCLHTGRWDDIQEPFSKQWQRLADQLLPLSNHPIWLMGDFNAPSHRRGESLDRILADGWLDTYQLAFQTDDGITALEGIDGWEDQESSHGIRIDYIFTNHPFPVRSSQVIFCPGAYGTVSDHRAVKIEC